jgi:hypothetical protein
MNHTALIEALALPLESRVDKRIPKKMLVEQGAPTVGDKHRIEEGIEDLIWIAELKPANCGILAGPGADEIAILAVTLRPSAKASRLIELIHRAIPYPVLLVVSRPVVEGDPSKAPDEQPSSGGPLLLFSVAPKRPAQNEVGKVVVDFVVNSPPLVPAEFGPVEVAFLASLSLSGMGKSDLATVYFGWQTRLEALAAARITGIFRLAEDATTVARRREALEAHSQLAHDASLLRARIARETQMARRVEMNIEIRRLEQQMAEAVAEL